MTDSLYIAWKYVTFNKMRSATLVACVTLIAALPLALELLLDESERQLLSRAQSTPLVLGARGSSLDLVMNTLYFDDEVPELISMTAVREVRESRQAMPIPIYARFQARGFPIVGTTIDYFDFRGLEVAKGRQMALLGECVVGATVGAALGLEPGDSLFSSPETVFDLAGVYPLKMRVVGILERKHTSDDLAVFVDVKTAWVVEGLGHGHEDVTKTADDSVIFGRSADNVVANAKLLQYTEITEANVDSFHFHGDPAGYSVSAVIAVPHDARAAAILRGRYLGDSSAYQIVWPQEVVDGLLVNIFRIKNVLDAVIALVGAATLLAIVLVFALSLRLRQRELATIFKLGCSRMTIVRLIGAELFLITGMSAVLCAGILGVVDGVSDDLVRALFIR